MMYMYVIAIAGAAVSLQLKGSVCVGPLCLVPVCRLQKPTEEC